MAALIVNVDLNAFTIYININSSATRIVNRRKRKWVLALRTIKASLTERGIPRYGATRHVLGYYGPLLPQLLVAPQKYQHFLIHEKRPKTLKKDSHVLVFFGHT